MICSMSSSTVFGRNLSAIAFACLVSACGGSDPQPSQTLMRAVEYPQCEPRVPTMAQLDAELQSAGIEIRAKSCASFGPQLVPTGCGIPVVLLRVVDVPQDQAPLAAPLGYRPKAEFPPTTALPCPTQ